MSERDEELEALRDEIRYLRRSRDKFRVLADETSIRAVDIRCPRVEVRKEGSWHRVYVNDAYIDGQESPETAASIAERLRKAFTLPVAAE